LSIPYSPAGRQEVGDRRQEAGDRRQEAGNRRQETKEVSGGFVTMWIKLRSAGDVVPYTPQFKTCRYVL
jgi:hypothetical protein